MVVMGLFDPEDLDYKLGKCGFGTVYKVHLFNVATFCIHISISFLCVE